ncbi:hypothetical protein [Vagococcus fluvialis]|uniref:hypothetical protein n=1 Tax=Vagococcus fluvialis TaxID=2738 RepID=UPI0022E3117B|nr:hypothetical protein [Vagococcus fluvialis]
MNEFKQVIDLLNNINGGLMILFGVGINQGYQKFKKWRKSDVQTIDDKVNRIETTVESLLASSLALSHDKLYEKCTQYINRGYITIGELDNLDYIFTSYKKLGGNGTGEHLYLEAKKLPLKGGE